MRFVATRTYTMAAATTTAITTSRSAWPVLPWPQCGQRDAEDDIGFSQDGQATIGTGGPRRLGTAESYTARQGVVCQNVLSLIGA